MTVIRGTRAHARFTCAICASDILIGPPRREPLGPGGAMVVVCDACASEPPRALYGPERAHQGAGGPLRHDELSRALRAKQGDELYERETEFNKRSGLSPAPATPKADVDLRQVAHEGRRRRMTGAAQKARSKGRIA